MARYNPTEWSAHIFDFKGSMSRQILRHVLVCSAVSVVVYVVNHWVIRIGIPQVAHTLIGVPLGLLLVFRTNSANDRYWEGRKLWGAILNTSRNFGRGVESTLAASPHRVASLLAWTSSFSWATMSHLRKKKDLGPHAVLLPAETVAAVLAQKHVPLAVCTQISRELVEARDAHGISEFTRLALEQNIQTLVDQLGGCERIHSTPLPYPYMVHLRRALLVYCFTLPFALVDYGWAMIPATFLIAYTLFGIEEIGVEIEDPFDDGFSSIPMEDLCTKVSDNLDPLIKQDFAMTASQPIVDKNTIM